MALSALIWYSLNWVCASCCACIREWSVHTIGPGDDHDGRDDGDHLRLVLLGPLQARRRRSRRTCLLQSRGVRLPSRIRPFGLSALDHKFGDVFSNRPRARRRPRPRIAASTAEDDDEDEDEYDTNVRKYVLVFTTICTKDKPVPLTAATDVTSRLAVRAGSARPSCRRGRKWPFHCRAVSVPRARESLSTGGAEISSAFMKSPVHFLGRHSGAEGDGAGLPAVRHTPSACPSLSNTSFAPVNRCRVRGGGFHHTQEGVILGGGYIGAVWSFVLLFFGDD